MEFWKARRKIYFSSALSILPSLLRWVLALLPQLYKVFKKLQAGFIHLPLFYPSSLNRNQGDHSPCGVNATSQRKGVEESYTPANCSHIVTLLCAIIFPRPEHCFSLHFIFSYASPYSNFILASKEWYFSIALLFLQQNQRLALSNTPLLPQGPKS